MTASRREWPLVAFTLLTQAAVGGLLALRLVRLWAGPAADDPGPGIVSAPLAMLGALFAVGLAASVGHLSRPLAAWLALRNLRRSPVSLEIALAVAFGITAALSVGPADVVPGSGGVRSALAGLAAVLGLALIWSMGRIYRLPTRPAWDHAATSIEFFTTAGLLGAAFAAAVTAFAARWAGGSAAPSPAEASGVRDLLLGLLAITLASAALEVALIPLQARVRLRASRAASLPETEAALNRCRRASLARVLLTLAAIAAAAFAALRQMPAAGIDEPAAQAVIVTLLLAAAESLIGRVMFYTERPIAGL